MLALLVWSYAANPCLKPLQNRLKRMSIRITNEDLLAGGQTRKWQWRLLPCPRLLQTLAHAGINVSFTTIEKVVAILYRFGSAKLTVYA